MSQMVTIKTELKNKKVVKNACKALQWEYEEGSTVKFHDGSVVTGLKINIPGWQYPVVVQDDAAVKYDNYGGRWGDISKLNRLKQMYSAEIAETALRNKGMAVSRTVKEDSTIVVVGY